MTVKKLCKIYGCDYSAMYRKIKRNIEKLEGHIDRSNGKIELDEYAVEFLLPDKVKTEKETDEQLSKLRNRVNIEQMNVKKSELRYDELSEKYYDMKRNLEEAEKRESDLKEKNTTAERRISELESQVSELSAKNAELEKENSELRKNQKKKLF